MAQVDTLQEEVDKLRVRTHGLANDITNIRLNIHAHECLKEKDWGKLFEMIKPLITHVVEGDSVGGFRDRLLRTELDLKNLKERFWQSSLIGAILGTLIGSGSKEAIGMFITWMMKK